MNLAQTTTATTAMAPTRPRIAAIDIGTHKIVVMIAEVNPNKTFDIKGIAHETTDAAVQKGMVMDIDAVVLKLQKTLAEATRMAGFNIHEAVTGIAGGHIQSTNCEGMVTIVDGEVSELDIRRAIETASAIQTPAEQQVLHTLPQEYTLDGHGGIQKPLGMSGLRLTVSVHLVTGGKSPISNMVKCITRCGVKTEQVILQPLASSYSVLSEDEKTQGVVLVDIGGGTTDLVIFSGGAIRFTAVLPIGGDHVTNDISQAMHTPRADAEEIKIRHGFAKATDSQINNFLEVPGIAQRDNRQMSQYILSEIIEARVQELFSLVQGFIEQSGFGQRLGMGVVLTGGSSLLPAIDIVANEVLGLPVRLGAPLYQGSFSELVQTPRYATVTGLLHMAAQARVTEKLQEPGAGKDAQPQAGKLKQFWQWVKRTF